MEEKGLTVNAGKTKIMICVTVLDLLQSSDKSHGLYVALKWAAAASSAKAVSGYNDRAMIRQICNV